MVILNFITTLGLESIDMHKNSHKKLEVKIITKEFSVRFSMQKTV